MLQPVPGTLVLRPLLYPQQLPGVRETVELTFEVIVREGIELLDAHDGDVADFAFAPCQQQVEIHLAAARHDTLHAVRGNCFDLADHRMKGAADQLRERSWSAAPFI